MVDAKFLQALESAQKAAAIASAKKKAAKRFAPRGAEVKEMDRLQRLLVEEHAKKPS